MNMMGRLTENDGCGNWSLKGVQWESLKVGKTITPEVQERLYGVLCKLKDYEDTGLSPADVIRVNDFERSQAGILLKKLCEERKKREWIPVEGEHYPSEGCFVLMSFDNFTMPLIGRYEKDEEGGAFYAGDDEESCASQGLFVNAWMPLPEPYRP